MKFKTTFILLLVFMALLVFIFLFDVKDVGKEAPGDKLVNLSSEDVESIYFKTEEGTITFKREGEDNWLISEPIEAKADRFEVDRIANDFSNLEIDRVVEEVPEDLEKYGIPQKEISLKFKGKEDPVKVLVGMENPLDQKFFAKREDETRVVLIASTHKTLLEKKVFDFREKKIFQYETDDVKGIELRSGDIQWAAEKSEEEWFLKNPVASLAEKSDITSLLSSLSDLKAKEFVSEEKNEEEMKKFMLDTPEHTITLQMPLENQEVIFFIQKVEDKLYATTSLSSKIVEVEDTIISKLEKDPLEIRETEVADFYAWEVNKVSLERGDLSFAVLEDEKEDKWHFDSAEKEEADMDKIEEFVRKIEALEAEEFIDPPLELKEFGLDPPAAKVTIRVKEDEEESEEISVLIGNTIEGKAEKEVPGPGDIGETEDKEGIKEFVFVKNVRFDYIFKVDADFLEQLPKKKEDWKKAEEHEEDPEKEDSV
ncbi:MAG: DUF4340 domain-containing protein [Candidatus Aminicenantes bacterium]|jgi:hypothetical protein